MHAFICSVIRLQNQIYTNAEIHKTHHANQYDERRIFTSSSPKWQSTAMPCLAWIWGKNWSQWRWKHIYKIFVSGSYKKNQINDILIFPALFRFDCSYNLNFVSFLRESMQYKNRATNWANSGNTKTSILWHISRVESVCINCQCLSVSIVFESRLYKFLFKLVWMQKLLYHYYPIWPTLKFSSSFTILISIWRQI